MLTKYRLGLSNWKRYGRALNAYHNYNNHVSSLHCFLYSYFNVFDCACVCREFAIIYSNKKETKTCVISTLAVQFGKLFWKQIRILSNLTRCELIHIQTFSINIFNDQKSNEFRTHHNRMNSMDKLNRFFRFVFLACCGSTRHEM